MSSFENSTFTSWSVSGTGSCRSSGDGKVGRATKFFHFYLELVGADLHMSKTEVLHEIGQETLMGMPVQ